MALLIAVVADAVERCEHCEHLFFHIFNPSNPTSFSIFKGYIHTLKTVYMTYLQTNYLVYFFQRSFIFQMIVWNLKFSELFYLLLLSIFQLIFSIFQGCINKTMQSISVAVYGRFQKGLGLKLTSFLKNRQVLCAAFLVLTSS